MRLDSEYIVALAASFGFFVGTPTASLRKLEEELWPRMQGDLDVPLDVFRMASRDALQALIERSNSLVLDNAECATLLAQARGSSSEAVKNDELFSTTSADLNQ